MFTWIPNALTISRCVFAVLVLYGALNAANAAEAVRASTGDEALRHATLEQLWHQFALLGFISGALTDFLDGWAARQFKAESRFGVWLDPIADKLLVASCLLMLAAEETIRGWSLLAAVIILCREILVSGLREYLAELRVSVPVTRLAKWKTTWQLVAVGFLICGEAGDKIFPFVTPMGLTLLWLSAIVTLYTGWDYMRAGLRHMIDE